MKRCWAAGAAGAAVVALAGCSSTVTLSTPSMSSSSSSTSSSPATSSAAASQHGSGELDQLPQVVRDRIDRSAVSASAFDSESLQFDSSASLMVVGNLDQATTERVFHQASELLLELEQTTGRHPAEPYLILIARDEATAQRWGRAGQGTEFSGLTFGGRDGSVEYVLLPGYLKTAAGTPRLADPRALTGALRYQLFLANALPDGQSYVLDPRWVISGFPAWYEWRGLSWAGPQQVSGALPSADDFVTDPDARWKAALFIDHVVSRFGLPKTMAFLAAAAKSADVEGTFQKTLGVPLAQAVSDWKGNLTRQREQIAGFAAKGYGLDGPSTAT